MYSKTQRQVMIGYLAFALVMLLFLHGVLHQNPTSRFDLILGAPLPLGLGVCAIENGAISARYGTIYRDEAPVSFWFYATLALVLGVCEFLWGILVAVRGVH